MNSPYIPFVSIIRQIICDEYTPYNYVGSGVFTRNSDMPRVLHMGKRKLGIYIRNDTDYQL